MSYFREYFDSTPFPTQGTHGLQSTRGGRVIAETPAGLVGPICAPHGERGSAFSTRHGASIGPMIGFPAEWPNRGAKNMDLYLEAALAGAYHSGRQRARVLTEPWIARQAYCPNCGCFPLARYGNNSRVGDFYCSVCRENYELKSKQTPFATKVDDGGYRAMLERLSGNANPNMFLLNYDVGRLAVTDLVIIPKHFVTVGMIEERKPLPPTARRAGWVGCRIVLQGIPKAGRIPMIRSGVIEPKPDVMSRWKHTLFLRKQSDLKAKGWLVHVMRCIEELGKSQFSLNEVYGFENDLADAYPDNQHARAKIRQKLQVLRDNGYLEFVGRGIYRLSGRTD